MAICQNCKEKRIVKLIYIDMDNKYEKWCKRCRADYRKDTEILQKG